MDYLATWACEHTFQERIAPKPLQIDQDKQHTKFFSTERRFQQSKSWTSRFKETRAWGHQRAVPLKVVILTFLASLLWKQLQVGMDMLPITTSTSNELINLDDFKRLWTPKI